MNVSIDLASPDWLVNLLRSPMPAAEQRKLQRAFSRGQRLIEFECSHIVEGGGVVIRAVAVPSALMRAIAPAAAAAAAAGPCAKAGAGA